MSWESIIEYFGQIDYGIYVKILLTVLTVIAFALSFRIKRKWVNEFANKRSYSPKRSNYLSKIITVGIAMLFIAIVSNIWGWGLQGVFFATSSFFTLVAVAFFAVWSVLSNITASLIIFTSFPYRVGDLVSIEGEEKFTGVLKDITLFYLAIERSDGSRVTVPTNVAIQKLVLSSSDTSLDLIKARKDEAKAEDAS